MDVILPEDWLLHGIRRTMVAPMALCGGSRGRSTVTLGTQAFCVRVLVAGAGGCPGVADPWLCGAASRASCCADATRHGALRRGAHSARLVRVTHATFARRVLLGDVNGNRVEGAAAARALPSIAGMKRDAGRDCLLSIKPALSASQGHRAGSKT